MAQISTSVQFIPVIPPTPIVKFHILTPLFSLFDQSLRDPHLSENDRQIQHPQSAGAPPVQVHRDGTRRHQQVGVAGQPAQRLLLLLHGTFRSAQLFLRC